MQRFVPVDTVIAALGGFLPIRFRVAMPKNQPVSSRDVVTDIATRIATLARLPRSKDRASIPRINKAKTRICRDMRPGGRISERQNRHRELT